MTDSLKLQVFQRNDDGTNAPVTGATVVLQKRDQLGTSSFPHDDLAATHAHVADGFYGSFTGAAANEPAAGEFLLVVTLSGMSPVVQRLTLNSVGEVLQARAGWGRGSGTLGAQAATVSIVNAGKKAKGDAPQHTTVNVVLFPRLELVAITGHDDHGNTEYAKMAEGRRNLLYKRKLLNDGALSTILHANLRATVTSVKDASRDPRGWIILEAKEKNPLAADAGKKRPEETVDRELTILDFFTHLQAIGLAFPGTLVEAGIFSHSWTMGVIIWNTSDRTARVNQRDPLDTDGRQKDWIPTGPTSQTPTGPVTAGPIMQGFPDLPQAFKKDASLHIWGCSHMPTVIKEGVVALQRLRAKIPRDQFFIVAPLTTPHPDGRFFSNGEENTTLDHLKRLIGQFIAGDYYGRALESGDLRPVLNYPGAAARFLSGVSVFGAAPGMGSLYGTHGGELTFFIDDEPRPKNPDPKDPRGENFAHFQWFRREFGDDFVVDDLKYVDYQKLRTAALPDPGFSTERWAMFYDMEQMTRGSDPAATPLDKGSLVMRLPTGLEVHRRVTKPADPRKTFKRPTPFTLNGANGHLYTFPTHALVRVERRGPNTVVIIGPDGTLDSAAFVATDGTTRWLTRPAGSGTFSVLLTPIPVEAPSFTGGNQWLPPARPLATVVNGVIEAVPPRCFW